MSGGHDAAGTGQRQLTDALRTPRWLRDVGRSCWLLVGMLLVVIGLIWLLAATYMIVGPMVCALIVAVVAMPVVRVLDRHMPRALAAALVLLAVVAVVVVVVVIVIAGITGQRAELSAQAAAGADRLQGWLKSAGVDSSSASGATTTAKSAVPQMISTLVHGVVHGIRGLTSVIFGLSFAALGTFFLLKDGPGMRGWLDRHVGLPEPVARTITGSVITSLRGYFRGVTIVAAFNGIVVGLSALLLNVPLAGTIAVVTFVTAYIPYIGAVVAGDADRRHPRERPAAEPLPALRDGSRPPPQPTRGARGDDRRGLPVRDARARARSPIDLRRRPDRHRAEATVRPPSSAG
jgi:putative heme transporter